MSEIEIITDGGRRRRWPPAEKLRIVEETLDDGASISVVARRNGVAPIPARLSLTCADRACSLGATVKRARGAASERFRT